MFRINNNKNVDLYHEQSRFERFLKRLSNFTPSVLAENHKLRAGVFIVLALVASYFTWTHGRLLPQSREQQIIAQAKSPLPPEWLEKYFGKKLCYRQSYCGPQADPDRDGLSNYEEFLFYTDPTNPDTDGDGIKDGTEVRNFQNPLGVGVSYASRDITNPFANNPLADSFIEAGVEEMKKGNVLSIDQLEMAADRLLQVPEFEEIPFEIIDDNSPQAIEKYVTAMSNLSGQFLQDEYYNYGQNIGDVSDLGIIDGYISSVALYATTMVYIETPLELFAFHKAYYGALVFQGLAGETQKLFLQGQITQDEAKDQFRALAVYYTRFIKDLNMASSKIKEKHPNFSLTFSE